MAYLEKLRLDKLRQSCVVIQKHIRGWLQRKKFLRERQAALTIQQYFRGQQTVRYAGVQEEGGIVWLSRLLTLCGGACQGQAAFPWGHRRVWVPSHGRR